MNKNLK